MTAGRPTKYNDEILVKAREYLDGFEDRTDAVPQIARLCIHLGIRRSTVYAWAKDDDKQEFSDIVEAVLCQQETILIDQGLNGGFNPNITKLLLAKHGYAEKQDINATVGFTVKIGGNDAEGL